jgi:Ca-activated chloride channel homolog
MRFVLFIFALLVSAGLAFGGGRSQVKAGNQAAKSKQFDQSLEHYQRAIEQGADSSVVLYDKGHALYDKGDYPAAANSFMSSLSPRASRAEQTEALYNLGNSFFQAEKYDEAVQAYREALKRNSGDADAKFNYELARYRLQQQKQQQQNPQDQNQQKKDQQKQDQPKPQDDQKKQDQQQQQQQPQDQQQADQQQNQQQPQQGQQMSKEDAERLLNALLQDEQNALKDAKKVKVATKVKREKDW